MLHECNIRHIGRESYQSGIHWSKNPVVGLLMPQNRRSSGPSNPWPSILCCRSRRAGCQRLLRSSGSSTRVEFDGLTHNHCRRYARRRNSSLRAGGGTTPAATQLCITLHATPTSQCQQPCASPAAPAGGSHPPLPAWQKPGLPGWPAPRGWVRGPLLTAATNQRCQPPVGRDEGRSSLLPLAAPASS